MRDCGDGVDMALDEVAAHTGCSGNGALEVQGRRSGEGTQVGAAESFRGYTDFERGRCKVGDCQACS